MLQPGYTFETERLECEVLEVRDGIAYCWVINGLWRIGFNAENGQAVEQGTDRRAWPGCSGEKIKNIKSKNVVKEEFRGICDTCHRNTNAPFFDGCMNAKCPHGFEPCF